MSSNPREFWILDAKAFGYHPKAFIKVNDMEREITKLQKNSEKNYEQIRVQEILPGTVTITREQFSEIFNKYDDKTLGQNPPEYSLLRELFGES